MPRYRFVDPTSGHKIDLSDGDWIVVKERLSYGEEIHLSNSSLTSVHFNPDQPTGHSEVGLDMKRMLLLRIATWVTDWSFIDKRGNQTEVTMANIEALDPDTAREITEALDVHVRLSEMGKLPSGNQTIVEINGSQKFSSASGWDGQENSSNQPTPWTSESS